MSDQIATCFIADHLSKLPAIEKPLKEYLASGGDRESEEFRNLSFRLEKDGILPLVLLIEMSTLDRDEDGELTPRELHETLSGTGSWMARAAADYALENFDRIGAGSKAGSLSSGELKAWSERHRPTAANRGYDLQDLDLYMLSGICQKFAPEPSHYRSLSEILQERKQIDYLWYKHGRKDRITPEFMRYSPQF
ncbi:MAG: hypothetical protein IPM23_12605 [Candidatus Melainabacteria bacterium]|nr:hypothetical protein [Candidatus Melainabacteria bacterium]